MVTEILPVGPFSPPSHEGTTASSETAMPLLESVWKNSIDGIRITDMDGRILAVNPAFCALVEMGEGELVGQPLSVIFADDEDPVQMLSRYRARFQEGQRELRFGREIHLRCGKRYYLEFALSVFTTEEGERCLTLVRDRTERRKAEVALRKSEQHFRSIWEQSSEAMRLTDEEGTILDVNEAFCRLMHVQREDIVGRAMAVLHRPHLDAGKILSDHRARFDLPAQVSRYDGTIGLRNGGEVEVEVSCVILGDTPGERRMVCLFRDLTERRAAERERLELERNLLESQRLESLGGLAGGIAHDFNNLLTAIMGNTSFAASLLPENSPARPLLANAEKTSLQAAELCKQMLAYAGRGKLLVRKLLLADLVQSMDHLLRISISRNVTLLIDMPSDLPPVEAEASQLQQVIVNLVINASEAIGPDAAGAIRLSAGCLDLDDSWLRTAHGLVIAKPGPYVVIEVSDSGPGMTADTKARIFDPFFTTKFTGRGLGLASVQGIVRRHSGVIQVDTEVGRGTTFRVALPARSGPVAPGDDTRVSSAAPAGAGLALIVDDEECIRTVASVMLRHAGFDVVTACNGEEGVACLRQHGTAVGLVLLDLTMPVMDGATALVKMRELRKDVPVLLMSGYSDSPLATNYCSYPQVAFLSKPFGADQFYARLTELMEVVSAPAAS